MRALSYCADSIWDEVCTRVNRAVVFIDNPCAEILHWHGGLLRLVQAGAADVREFSSFEVVRKSQKKAVFIISSLFQGVTMQILRDIITASNFQYTVIITTISQQAHLFNRTGTTEGSAQEFFQRLEEDVLEWMGNMNYTAEICHIPLLSACIGQNVFVTPTYQQLFSLLKVDVNQINIQYNLLKTEKKYFSSLTEIEAQHLPKNLQVLYKMFVGSINDFLEQIGVSEDLYSVGHTSRILVTELENFGPARNRRKTATERASLILVDRCFDVAGPVGHQPETLLDKILALLPRLPGHNNDVLVDMAPLCAAADSKVGRNSEYTKNSAVSAGCLAPALISRDHSLIHTLVMSKHKEAVMDVNRHLVDAASKEKLPISVSSQTGRKIVENLQSTLSLFRKNYQAILSHVTTLQVAMATVQALKHPDSEHHDKMQSVEKILMYNIATKNEPSLKEIFQIIRTDLYKPAADRLYTLDDIWCLLLYIYSLAGSDRFTWGREEKTLQDALVKAILEEKNKLPPITKVIVEKSCTASILPTIIEDVWDKLKSVGDAREDLKQLSNILDPGNDNLPATFRPFLKQMMEEIFSAAKPELLDIEYKSSGLKGFLKSGFGLFMNVNKPRPGDHPLLIVFVIGGVTSSEAKQIQDTLTSFKANTQIIIGSTQLVQPLDLVQSILCNDRINPIID